MKRQRFYIEAKCLKASVNFFVNYTFEELNKCFKKNDYPLLEDEYKFNSLGLYNVLKWDNKYYYLIWLPKFKRSIDNIGVLVHELHHVVEEQAREKGFENCKETKAYLIEYYYKEFLNKYNN